MKRLLSWILSLLTLLSLVGCTGKAEASADQVTFYYTRPAADYRYGLEDGVIASERREAAGHTDDLSYLLALYFHGPMDESLIAPFPSGTHVEEITWDDSILTIRLSSILSVLEGSELSLACACVAKTCMELTDADAVVIISEGLSQVNIRFTKDTLLLGDSSIPSPTEISE